MNKEEMVPNSFGADKRHMPSSRLHKDNKTIGTGWGLFW